MNERWFLCHHRNQRLGALGGVGGVSDKFLRTSWIPGEDERWVFISWCFSPEKVKSLGEVEGGESWSSLTSKHAVWTTHRLALVETLEIVLKHFSTRICFHYLLNPTAEDVWFVRALKTHFSVWIYFKEEFTLLRACRRLHWEGTILCSQPPDHHRA